MIMKKNEAKFQAAEIAEMALMCALMVIGKEALRMIPNVHPVALIIMLCVIRYGWKTMYPVLGFVVIQIALYGFGLWTVMYFYVWPILVLMCIPIRNIRKGWIWGIVGGIHGLTFGAMCAVPYIVTSGWKTAVAWWIAGLPFDVIHGVSNFIIITLLLPLLSRRLERIQGKVELGDK